MCPGQGGLGGGGFSLSAVTDHPFTKCQAQARPPPLVPAPPPSPPLILPPALCCLSLRPSGRGVERGGSDSENPSGFSPAPLTCCRVRRPMSMASQRQLRGQQGVTWKGGWEGDRHPGILKNIRCWTQWPAVGMRWREESLDV